jgi:UDP-4-amino-4,6-dideoxy-N-acetyl-beta-L-altrosamine transaminase/dTDP-4-dehydrorhamnose reductase
MKDVLITGGTGLLAGSAPLTIGKDWKITLWTRGKIANFHDIKSYAVDLESYEKVYKELEALKPSVVIHCAGLTNIEKCEENYYKAYLANVVTTKNLSKACSQLGIKFVYISTDQVLKDEELSIESSVGHPVNLYAMTKLQGEFETLKASDDFLVVRVNFVTWGSAYRKSFLDYIVDNLREGNEVGLFEDVIFNPVSAQCIFRVIDSLIEKELKGIFNLGSNKSISKYDFGLKVASLFELDTSLIKKVRIGDRDDLVKRPMNLSMSNSKVKSSIDEGAALLELDDLLSYLKMQEVEFKDKLNESILEKQGSHVISYSKQTISEVDFDSVVSCVSSPYLTQGPRVREFERIVAEYVGAKHAVAICNWTSGLHLTMLALGVGPGDNVITSPVSFVASSNCVLYTGANVHFCDIDPETLNMDPKKLDELCQKIGNVKVIIPVHMSGSPCDMEKLNEVAEKHKAEMVEDAAHGIGGRYECGTPIGHPKYSKMVGFSFHPVKNITTAEGGIITTNDTKIYESLIRLRSHGITKGNEIFKNKEIAFTEGQVNPWYYEMQELGFNYRITDLQCALGISQIGQIQDFTSKKLRIAKKYDALISKLKNIKTLQERLRDKSGNHLYMAKVDFNALGISRFELFKRFKEKNINLHVHYIPIHHQPYYKENVSLLTELKNAEEYYEGCVTLPMYPLMTEQEFERVSDAIKEIIG